jgi:tetratricopeptide (TPR) repeat protein
MNEHCFISYSNADGLKFATKLATELESGQPFIKVWFDKNEMSSSGGDWDEQIASAIGGCKCLLFVMSEDSAGKGSNCKEEWTWALKCKKPVICLVIDDKAEEQFRLNNRQKIYFNSNHIAGMAQLRKAVARIDAPQGALDELNHRLADAKRDLHRASADKQPRIQVEIDELVKQIETQQKIVDNPQAAEAQTQKNIEAGLERERKPEKPVISNQSTKFINPPPGIAPNYFQDRHFETEQVVKLLCDDAQRLITIVGRGGVGKTAMVCRLLKGLESGELPDGLGAMKVEGIVYLSESGSHRVNFANIFYDLCKLLPAESANELDAVYKNPQGSTESKMRAVLEKFTGADARVVLLLDNFEPLVDTETFAIRDAELDEALRAFLNGTHTAVNIVITTRVAPKPLNLTQPGRQRVLTLDEGLESPYAENILREMDSDGRMGLKSASAESLNRSRIRTRGFPRALEALFAILASDRYTTLEELLAMPTPENVVEALVGEAFNRLDTNAQKVMQALAVYNRPVTPAAVDYLLAPHIPAIDSAPILQRLANMHFARKESGRFYLHPVDRDFAFKLIPDDERGKTKEDDDFFTDYESRFMQHDLLMLAADYFAEARKPREEWKKLDDLSAQLAEFDLRCAASDYDTAASVLTETDELMQEWGHYRLTIQLNELILDKLKDNLLKMFSLNELGWAYRTFGETRKAITFYEQGLNIASDEPKNRQAEGSFLGSLGSTYADLGDARKAIEYTERALLIAQEIGDRKGEGARLGNLGALYLSLGTIDRSIEYLEQALVIDREIGNKSGESVSLHNLGELYTAINKSEIALNYYEQALLIRREISNLYGVGSTCGNISRIYIDNERYSDAIQFAQESIAISQEISSPILSSRHTYTLVLVYLFQNDLPNARATIEAALQYDVPENNHNVSALHGIIALRQGDEVTARGAFTRAIAQADEILAKTPDYYSALDAKGLSICGLTICDASTSSAQVLRLTGRGDPSMPTKTNDGKIVPPDETTDRDGRVAPTVDDAIETFRKARKIAPHAGVVKSTLRLFDELVKCDTEGILKDVRKAVEGE